MKKLSASLNGDGFQARRQVMCPINDIATISALSARRFTTQHCKKLRFHSGITRPQHAGCASLDRHALLWLHRLRCSGEGSVRLHLRRRQIRPPAQARGGHGIPELKSGHCTAGQCASGQLSLTAFLSLRWLEQLPGPSLSTGAVGQARFSGESRGTKASSIIHADC